jgi:hypothetical protein
MIRRWRKLQEDPDSGGTGVRRSFEAINMVRVIKQTLRGWVFLVIAPGLLTAVAGAQVSQNLSGITTKEGICQGRLPVGTDLGDIGVDARTLAHGVECVAADFNGDGFLDFAIFGTLVSRPPVVPVRRIRVLLFKENRVILNQLLDGEYEKLDLYGPTTTKGPFGEPATALPGLVKWGEGGGTEIFLYDSRLGHFKLSEYASEDG